MEVVLLLVAAAALYFAADRLLDRVEIARGRRFEQRSLVFFFLLLGLALAVFALIRGVLGG